MPVREMKRNAAALAIPAKSLVRDTEIRYFGDRAARRMDVLGLLPIEEQLQPARTRRHVRQTPNERARARCPARNCVNANLREKVASSSWKRNEWFHSFKKLRHQ